MFSDVMMLNIKSKEDTDAINLKLNYSIIYQQTSCFIKKSKEINSKVVFIHKI